MDFESSNDGGWNVREKPLAKSKKSFHSRKNNEQDPIKNNY
jgi:hypothetical protein